MKCPRFEFIDLMFIDLRFEALWLVLVGYQGFTAQLKDNLPRLKVFLEVTFLNCQSWFPDHTAESTGEDGIDSAEQSP